MTQATAEIIPQRDSYLVHWLVTFVLIGAAVYGFRRANQPVKAERFPVAQNASTADWYMVLRMPAVTSQYESGIDTMKIRFRDWLEMLTKEGYRPLTFSEVARAQRENAGVPRKSVVLVFDPGFRRTYEILEPILRELRWPAVWLSDEAVLNSRHREYVTYQTARNMVASGLWDVGLRQKDGSYLFSIGQDEPFSIGNRGGNAWALTAGSVAINRGPMRQLHRLNVNSDWTPADMLNRINAELPVDRPVYFTIGPVQNLMWGLTSEQPAPFDLIVRPQRRDTVVSWLGTDGLINCQLTASGDSLAGRVAFRFRWDEMLGNGIQVVIGRDRVTVEERLNFENRVIHSSERIGEEHFFVRALLVGNRVSLTVDGEPREVDELTLLSQKKGVTQLYLFDRIRDVARVKGLEISFEPLPDAAVILPSAL